MPDEMLTLLAQFAEPGLSLERFGLRISAAALVALVMSGTWVPR